jgi:hypothetical protein
MFYISICLYRDVKTGIFGRFNLFPFFQHFLPREPSKKRLKVKKVAETTSKMSFTTESEGKRPSTASQTYEAPINPGTKKNT